MQTQGKQSPHHIHYRTNMVHENSDHYGIQSEELKRKYCSRNFKIAMIGVISILIAIVIIVLICSHSSWWSSPPKEHQSNPSVSTAFSTLVEAGTKLVKGIF